MNELVVNVNWLAVVVGAVVAYAVGWLWYSPKLFGNKWMAATGNTAADGSGPPVAAMAFQALGTFLLAWLVGVTAANDALLTIILVALTIIVLMWSGGLFARRTSGAVAIECGYLFAMVVIMIVFQGIF